jgi:hypothetical protein
MNPDEALLHGIVEELRVKMFNAHKVFRAVMLDNHDFGHICRLNYNDRCVFVDVDDRIRATGYIDKHPERTKSLNEADRAFTANYVWHISEEVSRNGSVERSVDLIMQFLIGILPEPQNAREGLREAKETI